MFCPNFEGILKEFGKIMGKYRMLDEILWGLKGYKIKRPRTDKFKKSLAYKAKKVEGPL